MVIECVASIIFIPHKVDSDNNLAEVLTKYLVAVKKIELCSNIMFLKS